MTARGERGREAEELAARWLAERGYEVLDRNHATRRGEVDLVCRDGEVLCFVEVRSRTGDAQGDPAETVDRAKARRVIAAATDWALGHGGLEREIRFDLVSVVFGEGAPALQLIRGAFDGDGLPGMGEP